MLSWLDLHEVGANGLGRVLQQRVGGGGAVRHGTRTSSVQLEQLAVVMHKAHKVHVQIVQIVWHRGLPLLSSVSSPMSSRVSQQRKRQGQGKGQGMEEGMFSTYLGKRAMHLVQLGVFVQGSRALIGRHGFRAFTEGMQE